MLPDVSFSNLWVLLCRSPPDIIISNSFSTFLRSNFVLTGGLPVARHLREGGKGRDLHMLDVVTILLRAGSLVSLFDFMFLASVT